MLECPQCHELATPADKFCSQCGCNLQTQEAAALPVQEQLLRQAVEQLEVRIGGDQPYTPSLYEGKALFRTGMVFALVYIAHFVVQLFPYSAAMWWADSLLSLAEVSIPFWMALQTPQKNYRTILFVISIMVAMAALYRIVLPFL